MQKQVKFKYNQLTKKDINRPRNIGLFIISSIIVATIVWGILTNSALLDIIITVLILGSVSMLIVSSELSNYKISKYYYNDADDKLIYYHHNKQFIFIKENYWNEDFITTQIKKINKMKTSDFDRFQKQILVNTKHTPIIFENYNKII